MDRRVQVCNVRAQDALQRLEAEAYYAVYRALAASVMDWPKSELLSKVRRELHIGEALHSDLTEKVMADEEVKAITTGGPLPGAMQDASAHLRRQAASAQRRSDGQPPARSGARQSSLPLASSVSLSEADLTPDSDESGYNQRSRSASHRSKQRNRSRNGVKQPAYQQPQQLHQHLLASQQQRSRSRGSLPSSQPPILSQKRKAKIRVDVFADEDDGGHVGRAVWRHWPDEPQKWVKGVIADFKPDTNEHIITYNMHNPGKEQWEEYDFSAAIQGEDYVLDEAAPEIQFLSAARGLKRKHSVQETLPYDIGTLRHRMAGGSPAQLQDMQEALEQRARELTAEIIALAVPETDYRDPMQRAQHQLQATIEREQMLRMRLDGLAAA